MPRKGQFIATPNCKVEGCREPRHVYPGGGRSTYCRQHMRLRKGKFRPGFESMSGAMKDVLTHLRERKANEQIWIELRYPLAHGKTLRKLIEHHWIFKSVGLDGVRYCITDGGEQALAAFEQIISRRDGICPHCGVRPRHVRSSGHKDAFCIECERAEGKAERDLGIQKINPNRLCSRCHEKPLHQYPGGLYSTYCADCARIERTENERKVRREHYQQIQASGEIPLCKQCKQKPVHLSRKCVSRYCDDCLPVMLRREKLKRALKRAQPQRLALVYTKPLAHPRPDELALARQQKQALRLDYVPDEAVALIIRAMQGSVSTPPDSGTHSIRMNMPKPD